MTLSEGDRRLIIGLLSCHDRPSRSHPAIPGCLGGLANGPSNHHLIPPGRLSVHLTGSPRPRRKPTVRIIGNVDIDNAIGRLWRFFLIGAN